MKKDSKLVIVPPEQYSEILIKAEQNTTIARFYLQEMASSSDDAMLLALAEYFSASYNLKVLLETPFGDPEWLQTVFSKIADREIDGIPLDDITALQVNTFAAGIVTLKTILKNKFGLSMEIH